MDRNYHERRLAEAKEVMRAKAKNPNGTATRVLSRICAYHEREIAKASGKESSNG